MKVHTKTTCRQYPNEISIHAKYPSIVSHRHTKYHLNNLEVCLRCVNKLSLNQYVYVGWTINQKTRIYNLTYREITQYTVGFIAKSHFPQ